MATRGPDAVLGVGSKVRGRVSGSGNLQILGTVEGDVSVRGHVTVAEGASVQGTSLEADQLVIEGGVDADVQAEGDIHILANAAVRGRLRGASIRLDEGASISAEFDVAFDLPAELLA